jgi:hypothetical protein
MLPEGVKQQTDAIRRSLSSHGWSVVEVEHPYEDEWWAAEIWQIQSEWSPQGVRAYLTFLVDPMGGRNDVWAVCASRQRPTQQSINDKPTMRLMNVWQQELPLFVNGLSQFRVESTDDAR